MLAPDTLLQNRYLIVRPIGKGGMGAVYLARDQRLGNTIALKETFFEDETLRKAFEREARLLASLRHPALPRVIDHFTEDAGQFLVMEFIQGDDLEEMFTKQGGRPFPLSDVLKWADQLLDALDYLHTQEPPIIHRDIKPQNLKLAARGQIILLDFGLAKGSAAGMSQVSANASIFGYTPTYAPLEQVHGAGTDTRSDLYSLAATLYHLLTGTKPPDALARASAVIGGQPDPLRPAHELNRQVPPAVAQVLAKAMSIHADQRPSSAEEMRALLSDAALSSPAPSTYSSGDGATVIIPPHAQATAAPVTSRQGSDATVIDAVPSGTIKGANASKVIDDRSTVIEEEKEQPAREAPAPLAPGGAAPTTTTMPLASPARSRLPLMVAGLALLLVVAGVVIYAMSGGFNTNMAGTSANDAGIANRNPATPSPAQTNKQAAAAPAERSKEATSQQAREGRPSKAEATATTPASGDRAPLLPQRPRLRERLRQRP